MNLAFYNGQTQSMSQLRPRPYIRSFPKRMQNDTWMGYDVERGQIQEGFALQVSPLLSQDERTIDAVIKCTIDQVEKLVAVPVDLPGYQGQMQRAEIQVPQLVSWRLHGDSGGRRVKYCCSAAASSRPQVRLRRRPWESPTRSLGEVAVRTR